MNGVDITVIIIVSVAVLAVTGWLIYRKVTKKGGCPDCNGCTMCGKCKDKDNK